MHECYKKVQGADIFIFCSYDYSGTLKNEEWKDSRFHFLISMLSSEVQ
jgi:hypothetical protein